MGGGGGEKKNEDTQSSRENKNKKRLRKEIKPTHGNICNFSTTSCQLDSVGTGPPVTSTTVVKKDICQDWETGTIQSRSGISSTDMIKGN